MIGTIIHFVKMNIPYLLQSKSLNFKEQTKNAVPALLLILLLIISQQSYAQVSVTATAGTTGPTSYTTVNAAFTAINAGTHQGAITISIVSNTTETAACVLNSSGAGTATYTSVLLRPVNDGVTIAGPTVTGRGLIELNGADNIAIDGDNPNTSGLNKNLTITNSAATTVTYTSVIRIATSTLVTTADNITIRNCNLNGSGNSFNASGNTSFTATQAGTNVIFAGAGASTAAATTAPSALSSNVQNSASGQTWTNLTIDNNSINSAGKGICIGGATDAVCPTLTITNNIIGNPTVGATNQIYWRGISINGGFGSATGTVISGNTIYIESFCGSTSAPYGLAAIDIGRINGTTAVAARRGTISNNKILRVKQNNTGGYPAFGIILQGGNNNTVSNNFIQNILNVGSGSFSTTYGAQGIFISSGNNHNIYHNTVSLTGTDAGSGNIITCLSFVGVATTGCDVRNNIFSNTCTSSSTTSSFVGVYFTTAPTAGMALIMNNNAYYTGSTSGLHGIGQVSTTKSVANLYTVVNFNPALTTPATNWRAITSVSTSTNDNASVGSTSAAPFVSSSDIHLNNSASNISDVEQKGSTTTGVTTDIDGNTRPNSGTTIPDIGADEVAVITPPVISFTSISPNSNQCTATSRLVTVSVTTPVGTVSGATLNYNNGAAGSVAMTNITGTTWTGTIPAASPTNTIVTWSVTATNTLGGTATYTGISYQDDPNFGLSATATATPSTICSGNATSLSLSFGSVTPPTYTAPPAVTNPTTDEDFGNITITQGATTILNNTTGTNTLVGTIGTATGTAGSYSNFSAFGPYTLRTGLSYNFSASTINTAFGNAIGIYIDYNRDGDFIDVGEAVYVSASTTSGSHTETGSFTVPASVSFGYTRMRIVVNEGAVTGPTMSVSWGEYEEYLINLQPNVTAYSWSDGTSSVGSTNPLSQSPTTNTSYTCTATVNNCAVVSNTVPVTVTTVTAPTADVATSSQCGSAVPTVSVLGTAANMRWYSASTAGTLLQTGGLTYTTAISSTTTFFVEQVSGSCESTTRTPLTVTVSSPDAVTAYVGGSGTSGGATTPPNDTICIGATENLYVLQTGSTNTYSYTWSCPTTGNGLGTTTGNNISVTPTIAGTYVYTVTAVDGSCTTTSTVTILARTALSGLSYSSGSTVSYCSGVAITNNTPTITGTPTSYSISPALPSGLTLNTTTGVISGTPSATATAVNYTITARNGGCTTNTVLNITVISAITGLNYTTPVSYCRNQVITTNSPTVTGTPISYSVSPALPAGLSLNTTTGDITGTPTGAISAASNYTVTVSNGGCTTTRVVSIAIIDVPSSSVTPTPANTATNVCYGGVGAITAVSWAATASATSYDVYFGVGSVPASVTATVTTNSWTISPVLIANTTYSWRVVAKNSCGDAISSATWTFTTAATPCVCTPVSSNTSDYISAFTVTGGVTNFSNPSGGLSGTGYGNFYNTFSASLNAGSSLNFTETYVGGSHGFNIWVDLNNNGVFETSERLYASAATATGFTGTITIPMGTPDGDYRMRIRAWWNNNNPDPCTTIAYGEAEDYKITVVTPTGCTGAPTGGTVTVTPIEGPPSSTYSVSATGFTSALNITYLWQSNTNGAGWVDIGIASATYSSLTGLIAPALGTNVQYRLLVTCTNSSQSAFSSIGTFTSGYCRPSGTNGSYWITNFTTTSGITNINNTSTAGATGYSNFTAQSCSQFQGSAINLSISTNTSTHYFYVWVDWNNDGDFVDAGEAIVTSTTTFLATYTGSYTIPLAQAAGSYRMRIANNWSATILTSCGAAPNGEYEDYTFTVVTLPPCTGTPTGGTAIYSGVGICNSGSVTITASGYSSSASGLVYQWQSSNDNFATNIVNISGATIPASYNSGVITSTTYYRLRTTCSNTGNNSFSNIITITVLNPTITSFKDSSRCGTGTVTLEATGSAGTTLNWYNTVSGGSSLGTGSPFTTPSISTTTDYWVSARTGGTVGTVGPASPTAQGGTQGTQTVNWDVTFNVTQATTLQSVDVFPIASGEAGLINIYNSGGTLLTSVSYTTSVSGGSIAQTVPVNLALSVGTNYEIYTGTSSDINTSPVSGIRRNESGASYPYTSSSINITGNGFDNTYYMGIYNWKFTDACESNRTKVTATIIKTVPNPTVNISTSNICIDSVVKIWAGGSSITGTSNLINENFNSTAVNALPSGWSRTLAATDVTIGAIASNNAGGTANEMNFDCNNANFASGNYILSLPVVNATNLSNLQFTFLDSLNNYSATTYPYTIGLESSTNGTSWTPRWTFTPSGSTKYPKRSNTVSLSPLDGQPTVYLRFILAGFPFGAYDWYIDNVNLSGSLNIPANYTWSPTTGLYIDAAATVPYNSTTYPNRDTLYAKPTDTITYTVSASSVTPARCVSTNTITVNVSKKPTAIIDSLKLFVCDGSALLQASSVIPPSSTLNWTNISGSGSSAVSGNPATVTGLTAGTSIYQLKATNGQCIDIPIGKDTIVTPTTSTTDISLSNACNLCVFTDGTTKTFYNSTDGKIIAKIQDDGTVTPDQLNETQICVNLNGSVQSVTDNIGYTQPYLQRQWTIHPTNGTRAVVTLYFTDAELTALQAAANSTVYQFSSYNLWVTKYSGGQDGSFTPPASTGGVYVPSTFSAYGSDHKVEFVVDNFSTFYIHPALFPFSALPVEFVSFTGWNSGNVNQLQWKTASESNTLKYIIEKSIDGRTYSYIGEKPAAGNSTQLLTYDFTDNNPVIGNNYYRLKVIDIDGKISFSNVVNIPVSEAASNNFTRVYPNPTGGKLNVEIQSTSVYDTKIIVYDIVGNKVFEQNADLVKGLNTINFDFSSLAKGTYLLNFTDNTGKSHITKFVKD